MTGEDAAYSLIGRVIIEWGLLEQQVVRQIQKAKDPTRVSPFPPDIDERTFSTKLARWVVLHRPTGDDPEYNQLEVDARAASKMRNDLCHHVFDVVPGFTAFSIGVHRRELNWRKSFAKWARKWANADPNTRPSPPQDEVLRYGNRELEELLAMISSIRERMEKYSAITSG